MFKVYGYIILFVTLCNPDVVLADRLIELREPLNYNPIQDYLVPADDLSPIEFKAIVLKYNNGQVIPLNLSLKIIVDGREIERSVKSITDELNNIERRLNRVGKTIRNDASVMLLTHIPLDRKLITEQSGILNKYLKEIGIEHSVEKYDQIRLDELVEKAKAKAKKKALQKVRDLAEDLPEVEDFDLPEIQLPSLRRKLAVKIPEFKADKERQWDFLKGNPKIIAAFGKARLRTRGVATKTDKSSKVQVDGVFGVHMFGLGRQELGGGYANLEVSEGHHNSGNIRFQVFGRIIYDRSLNQQGSQWNDAWSKSSEYKNVYPFNCGPIQCVLSVGARGDLYYNWSVGVGGLSAYGSAAAGGRAVAFASAEASIFQLAGVGAKAELLIFDISVDASGLAQVKLDSRAVPEIEVNIRADSHLEALNGKIYAYGYIRVPYCKFSLTHQACGVKKNEVRSTLLDEPGFRKSGNILSFRMKLSPFHSEVDGRPEDIRPEDLQEGQKLAAIGREFDLAERENKIIELENQYARDKYETLQLFKDSLTERNKANAIKTLVEQNRRISEHLDRLEDY